VIDRQSGRQLGQLADSSIDVGDSLGLWPIVTDALYFLVHSRGAWRFLRYRLPSLTPDDPLILPGPSNYRSSDQAGLEGEDNRIVAVAGGVASVWDTRTKTMIGAPLTLGSTPDEQNRFRSYASFTRRPGHPDEIAIVAPGSSVQLWNLSSRRLLRTFPTSAATTSRALLFDPTGTRLAVLTSNHTVERWDVDTGTPVRTSLPAPDTTKIIGFTGDGYLISLGDSASTTLQFWDLKQGLVSGTMPLETSEVDSPDGLPTDRFRLYRYGLMPVDLPVTTQLWSDRLCSTSGRDFTARERKALPPGVASDNPCTHSMAPSGVLNWFSR
jgi:WD40 repeat protein